MRPLADRTRRGISILRPLADLRRCGCRLAAARGATCFATRISHSLFLIILAAMLLPLAPAKALSMTPAQEDAILLAAAVASGESRHHDAILLYEQVIRANPERLWDASAPLAFQYAWAGRLTEARREFHRARVLHPEDFEVLLGEILVLNWMGRHLTSWQGYEKLHRWQADRVEPLIGLAAAQNWSGNRERSLESLAAARVMDPGNRDAAAMESAIREGLTPKGGAYHDFSRDSDGFQVSSLWFEGTWHPRTPWTLTPYLNLLAISQDGEPDIDEAWLGTRFAGRAADRTTFGGRIVVLTNRPEGADYFPVIGDARVVHRLSDLVHVTGYAERFALTSYAVFPDKITGFLAGASAEIYPDWLTRVRVSADRAGYSDDNGRWDLWARADRLVWAPARVRVGMLTRYLDFDQWRDNGIWTPDSYWAVAGLASFEAGQRDHWGVTGSLELGPAHESSHPTTMYVSFRLGAYKHMGRFTLEFDAGHSEGDLQTWRGFDRTTTHLGARYRF